MVKIYACSLSRSKTIKCIFIWQIILFIPLHIYSKNIAQIFSHDENVIYWLNFYVHWLSLGFAPLAIIILVTNALVAYQKPIQSMFERWVQLDAVSYVDMIIPFQTEQDIVDMVLTLKPDIRIVGEEYKDVDHTGKGLCPIFYNSRKHSFSSTELRERIKDD